MGEILNLIESVSGGFSFLLLHDLLAMRKLTARWVPKSLSDEQMATRASVCSALLNVLVPLRLLTVDEISFLLLLINMSRRKKFRFVSG